MSDSLHSVDYSAYLAQPSETEREIARLFRDDERLAIFDIGACEGEDSVRYARHFPNARVFAFEPLPANHALVQANFQRYQARNATLYPIALSDRRGEAVFHVSSGRPKDLFSGKNWNYGNKSSSLLPPALNQPMHGWVEFKESITVPTDTLDDFCRDHAVTRIDFIHMDVQGAEHLVLSGARTMMPRITAIWLEVAEHALYLGQKTRTDMEDFMRENGFVLAVDSRRSVEGDQLYVNRRRLRAWSYLAGRQVAAALRGTRAALGRARRAGLG